MAKLKPTKKRFVQGARRMEKTHGAVVEDEEPTTLHDYTRSRDVQVNVTEDLIEHVSAQGMLLETSYPGSYPIRATVVDMIG